MLCPRTNLSCLEYQCDSERDRLRCCIVSCMDVIAIDRPQLCRLLQPSFASSSSHHPSEPRRACNLCRTWSRRTCHVSWSWECVRRRLMITRVRELRDVNESPAAWIVVGIVREISESRQRYSALTPPCESALGCRLSSLLRFTEQPSCHHDRARDSDDLQIQLPEMARRDKTVLEDREPGTPGSISASTVRVHGQVPGHQLEAVCKFLECSSSTLRLPAVPPRAHEPRRGHTQADDRTLSVNCSTFISTPGLGAGFEPGSGSESSHYHDRTRLLQRVT